MLNFWTPRIPPICTLSSTSFLSSFHCNDSVSIKHVVFSAFFFNKTFLESILQVHCLFICIHHFKFMYQFCYLLTLCFSNGGGIVPSTSSLLTSIHMGLWSPLFCRCGCLVLVRHRFCL